HGRALHRIHLLTVLRARSAGPRRHRSPRVGYAEHEEDRAGNRRAARRRAHGARMKPVRSAADVSTLPTVTFGPRSLMWWGTMGFATIEGWTSALLIGAYLYLRQNYEAWPP